MASDAANSAAWLIAFLATAGVILRPWRVNEAVWAVLGAAILVAGGLLPWRAALDAVAKGTDVYLFLVGMMLLAELARQEGLFDHVAARAAVLAHGSPTRLFSLIYVVGIGVTVFLSNDATAVVLTPAVFAAARAAGAEPLPYLFICAFIANAASFVLPISNPANLVVFASHMPALAAWLGRFGIASLLAIGATWLALRLALAGALRGRLTHQVTVPALSHGGRLAAGGIALTAIVLLTASSFGLRLGLPTFLAGALTSLLVLALRRQAPWPILRGVSWAVLPLVAGLFVLVESLDRSGATGAIAHLIATQAARAPGQAAWLAGLVTGVGSNLVNNLPAGLLAAAALADAHPPAAVTSAVLVGIDLGPNLSVTGSLATVLWLVALRREGVRVSTWRFLALGALVMPPALILALAGLRFYPNGIGQ